MASGNTRFKTENGLYVTGGNAEFTNAVTITGNCSVSGDVFYIGGDLTVEGTKTYIGGQVYATDIVASIAGLKVGNSTYAFDVYSANLFVNTAVYPLNNTIPLGNTSRRFITYANSLDVSTTALVSGNVTISGTSHAIAGNVNIDTGTLFVDATNNRLGVNTASPTQALTVIGNANISANVITSAITINNAIFTSNNKTVTSIAQVVIDSFALSESNCAKYLLFIRNTGNTIIHSIELIAVHEGTNILFTQYGEINNSSLGTFDIAINGVNAELKFTAAAQGLTPNATHPYTVKLLRTQIT